MGKATQPPTCKICGVAHRGPCFQRQELGPKTVEAKPAKRKAMVVMDETPPPLTPEKFDALVGNEHSAEAKAWKPNPGPKAPSKLEVAAAEAMSGKVTIVHERVRDLSPEALKAIAEAKAILDAAGVPNSAKLMPSSDHFDKRDYQREYMRKRRAAARAAKGKK